MYGSHKLLLMKPAALVVSFHNICNGRIKVEFVDQSL